jgi:selenide,water dikinase
MNETKINLSICGFNHNQGCAAKVRKAFLKEIINFLPDSVAKNKEELITGYDAFDDAAIYKIDQNFSVVFTVDFITPVTNEPEAFGRIAVANSLSDIYAKGALPCLGLNILGFPQDKIDLPIVKRVLLAGYLKAEEGDTLVVGGHTVNLSEFFYGLAAFGFVRNKDILLNSGARTGDALVLTKPLGTNIILTLVNRMGIDIEDGIIENCLTSMSQLNKAPSLLMKEGGANACTDISGYGFIGHLSQMLEASGKKAVIYSSEIPLINKAIDFVDAACHYCPIEVNKADYQDKVGFLSSVPQSLRGILFDAQTSGGLLISIPEDKSKVLLEKMHQNKIDSASIIGKIIDLDQQDELIRVE